MGYRSNEDRSVPFHLFICFCFYLADAKYTFNSEQVSGKNDQYFVEKLACVARVKKGYVKVGTI